MHRIPILFTILISILGGIYFGFFSCGGYAWHKIVFITVFGLAIGASIYFSFLRHKSWLTKFGYIISAALSFVIFEAAGAALYPSMPETLLGLLRSFIFALVNGAC